MSQMKRRARGGTRRAGRPSSDPILKQPLLRLVVLTREKGFGRAGPSIHLNARDHQTSIRSAATIARDRIQPVVDGLLEEGAGRLPGLLKPPSHFRTLPEQPSERRRPDGPPTLSRSRAQGGRGPTLQRSEIRHRPASVEPHVHRVFQVLRRVSAERIASHDIARRSEGAGS